MDFQEFADVLPLLPQAFFERMLSSFYSQESSLNIDFVRKGGRKLIDVVLSLPIGKNASSFRDCELPLNGYLEQLVDRYDLLASNLPFLPTDGVPFLVSELSEWSTEINEEESEDVADLEELIETLNTKIRKFRIEEHQGRSPWRADIAADFGFNLHCTGVESEVTLRLVVGDLFLGAGMFKDESGAFSSPRLPSSEMGRRWRFETQLSVIGGLVDEGWDEFANASLAFLLITQTALNEQSLECDWSKLNALLVRLSELPGHQMVNDAISFVLGQWQSSGAGALPAILLRSRYPSLTSNDRVEGLENWVTNYRLIEQDIIEKLGTACWLRLPIEVKSQLADAEQQWSSLHRNLGTRHGDFGALATSYTKVVEITLLKAFEPIAKTEAFVEYWRARYHREPDSHLTVGPMIHAMKSFSKLPEALQGVVIKAGIRLQADPDLLRELLGIVEVRNRGAHTAAVKDKDVLKIREAFYAKKILRRMMDLIGA